MATEKITANVPSKNSLWEHKRKRTAYLILSVSNTEATDPEFVPTVTYLDVTTGKEWSRPLHVFVEKFSFVGMPIMKASTTVLPDAKTVLSKMPAAAASRTSLENVQDVLDAINLIKVNYG